MTNKPLIRVEKLQKFFPSGNEQLQILKDLSFSVDSGSSMAIHGVSGSGKSTLLNILGGLDRVCAGSVMVSGQELTQLDEKALTRYRSRLVGFVFQFHYLLKDFTALENVMLPAFVAGSAKRKAIEKAKALLVDVKLEKRWHHYPSQLSGGERQRVAVARSLINDPEIVLADEPTGNLDPANRAIVTDILYGLVRQYNKTLLLVTHDEQVAARADSRYVLDSGVLRETLVEP